MISRPWRQGLPPSYTPFPYYLGVPAARAELQSVALEQPKGDERMAVGAKGYDVSLDVLASLSARQDAMHLGRAAIPSAMDARLPSESFAPTRSRRNLRLRHAATPWLLAFRRKGEFQLLRGFYSLCLLLLFQLLRGLRSLCLPLLILITSVTATVTEPRPSPLAISRPPTSSLWIFASLSGAYASWANWLRLSGATRIVTPQIATWLTTLRHTCLLPTAALAIAIRYIVQVNLLSGWPRRGCIRIARLFHCVNYTKLYPSSPLFLGQALIRLLVSALIALLSISSGMA